MEATLAQITSTWDLGIASLVMLAKLLKSTNKWADWALIRYFYSLFNFDLFEDW